VSKRGKIRRNLTINKTKKPQEIRNLQLIIPYKNLIPHLKFKC